MNQNRNKQEASRCLNFEYEQKDKNFLFTDILLIFDEKLTFEKILIKTEIRRSKSFQDT